VSEHEFAGEPDFYDPEVIRAMAERAVEDVEDKDSQTASYLRRRQSAYKRLFNSADPTDLRIVMEDLMQFSRAMQPTWDVNPKRQDLLEGRRELFLRIVNHTRLDFDTLYLMYTDAATKLEK